MKVTTPERTGLQAVEQLRAVYDRYKDRPRGGGKLTLKIIMEQVGVQTIATVSLWLSAGERHHEPKGAVLANLNEFLDKAKDKAWLEKLITKGRKK